MRLVSAKYSLLFLLASRNIVCKSQGDRGTILPLLPFPFSHSNEVLILALKLSGLFPKIFFLISFQHLIQSKIQSSACSPYIFPLVINLSAARIISEQCTVLAFKILFLSCSMDTEILTVPLPLRPFSQNSLHSPLRQVLVFPEPS